MHPLRAYCPDCGEEVFRSMLGVDLDADGAEHVCVESDDEPAAGGS